MFHEQEWKSIVIVPLAVEKDTLPKLNPSYQWDFYNGEPHVAIVAYQLAFEKRFGFTKKGLPKIVFQLWGFVKTGNEKGIYRFQQWEDHGKKEIKTFQEIEFQEGGMGGYQKPIMDGNYTYGWSEKENQSRVSVKTHALPQPLSFDPLSGFLWQRTFLLKGGAGLSKLSFSDGFAWDTQTVELKINPASELRAHYLFMQSLPALVETGYVVRNLKIRL